METLPPYQCERCHSIDVFVFVTNGYEITTCNDCGHREVNDLEEAGQMTFMEGGYHG